MYCICVSIYFRVISYRHVINVLYLHVVGVVRSSTVCLVLICTGCLCGCHHLNTFCDMYVLLSIIHFIYSWVLSTGGSVC
jgi:hypothetical protein